MLALELTKDPAKGVVFTEMVLLPMKIFIPSPIGPEIFMLFKKPLVELSVHLISPKELL